MPFPYIFTFYSFKGGVGRSMALMNTAYRLAGWGRHVLIIDMDLEAPGVSNFLARHEELSPSIGAHPRDVLALLHEARIALEGEGTIEQKAARLPPLDPYLRSVLPEKLAPLQPKIGQLGRLDVLGVNLESAYPGRLAALNLKDLPNERLAALSALLHFYFKARRFPHRPLGLPDFEPPVSTPYDYILVDSRTGLTETGGLCIGPLADRLVVLTGLNDQNVEGTRHFFNEAGIRPGPRVPWDDADPVNEADSPPTLGPKPTLVVASPLPIGELTHRRERLIHMRSRLGVSPNWLSYHPQLAFLETVFVRDYPEEYLAQEYDSLAQRVMVMVRDDFSTLSDLSTRLFAEDDPAGAVRAALRLTPTFPDLGLGLLTSTWNNLDNQKQKHRIPFLEYCSLHAHIAHVRNPVAAATAFDNWGNALSNHARTKQGEKADQLFALASEKYAAAVHLKPDLASAFSNWGNALSDQATTKQGEEADQLFAAAGEKYTEAVRISPDQAITFYNWGNANLDQAKTKDGEAADRLFALAGGRYAEATRLKPDHAPAYNNWGNALTELARMRHSDEADRLFAEAGDKYAMALRVDPDRASAFYNWGNALSLQAKRTSGDEAMRLLAQARDKLLRAEEISTGSGTYSLACIYGLAGDPAEAVRWLRLALQHEKANLKQIESDSDFDPVRDHPLFTDLLDSLRNPSPAKP